MPGDPPGVGPDPIRSSLANLRELLFGCLEAIGARRVIEVGAGRGSLTAELLAWGAARRGEIVAIDPAPEPELSELAARRPELELIERPSLEVLGELPLADAVILDGDHNFHTLREELGQLEGAAPGDSLPLVLMHDLGWPHARRDSYHELERIPPERRQPAGGVFVVPGDPGVATGGIHFECAALVEGGTRNGTMSAVENFLTGRAELRFALVPAFFGFGALWHREAPWADALEALLADWDRNALVARLERNRVHQIAEWSRNAQLHRAIGQELAGADEAARLLERVERSRAYALARAGSRLARLLRRGP